MKREIICLIVFSFMILLIFDVSAYDIAQGSDWKWAYSQNHNKEDMIKTGMIITDQDIAFAKIRVNMSAKDCGDSGEGDESGIWCVWAKQDREALQRMLDLQAEQASAGIKAPAKSGDFLKNISDFLRNLFSFLF